MDILNEVLNIDFDEEVAKISEVKVGGKKKISTDSARFDTDAPIVSSLILLAFSNLCEKGSVRFSHRFSCSNILQFVKHTVELGNGS